MKTSSSKLFFSLILLSLGFIKSHAQVVLTVDYSNLAAVKFTATANFSAIDHSSYKFNDGIALLGFLTSSTAVIDIDGGAATPTSTLTDSLNTLTANSTFNRLSTWNDANPLYYPNNGNGIDLTLWNDPGQTPMTYSIGSQAFYGEAIFDLSGYSATTGLFPALNATGTVEIWHGHGTIGTWQVVGVAVPEPSTYAAIFGVIAVISVVAARRQGKNQSS